MRSRLAMAFALTLLAACTQRRQPAGDVVEVLDVVTPPAPDVVAPSDAPTPRDASAPDEAPADAPAPRTDSAPTDAPAAGFALTSPAFVNGGTIPARPHACSPAGNYGTGTSPPLAWTPAPGDVRSYALLVDDPTASDWTHWVLFDIPAATNTIAQGATPAGALVGAEQMGARRYAGPCPPSGTHRYSFRLYALDVPSLGLSAGATKSAVVMAMAGHVLAQTELVGTVAAGDL